MSLCWLFNPFTTDVELYRQLQTNMRAIDIPEHGSPGSNSQTALILNQTLREGSSIHFPRALPPLPNHELDSHGLHHGRHSLQGLCFRPLVNLRPIKGDGGGSPTLWTFPFLRRGKNDIPVHFLR
jgi:hypothetical protein